MNKSSILISNSQLQTPNWQPTASIETLKARADIIKKIRDFFAARNVLEIETPLLCSATVSDPHIHSFHSIYQNSNENKKVYLQTSPEYAMKRLLAAGSGCIFQICKAFRNGEYGKKHNPEFTMLEWYRLDYDHHDLMQEVNTLLEIILNTPSAEYASYAEIFQRFLNINPLTCSLAELHACAHENGLTEVVGLAKDDRDGWLDILLTHFIEPHLGHKAPQFIYDYPVSQAALAKIRSTYPPVGERFEVYVKGIELANGYHELTNASLQRERFLQDFQHRKNLNYEITPIDEYLLAALGQGMPDCAGVALGLDRLIMLALNKKSLAEVTSFDFERA